jgi:phosphoribosylglycinamide formyltransferase 1
VARLRTAVLISGRGSNLQALIDACAAPEFPAEIVLVIANRADAQGLERAARARLPTRVIPHGDFATREAFGAAIDRALRDARVELVCLAGFMRVLDAKFVADWRDRLINIHPSLLPQFSCLDTHARALAARAARHGCTVHFVRDTVDSGPIVVQGSVPVLSTDTAETLAARVLAVEHRAYPLALKLIAEGRVSVRADGVEIDGRPGPLRLDTAA